jgi:hypothetical protein
MVDRISDEAITNRQKFSSTIIPALFLGVTTSIRVLGPLAGILVLAYGLWKFGRKFTGFLAPFILYGLIAVLAMVITWPYLWQNPLARFIEVFGFMSDNPTQLSVLFGGEVYRAGELPRRYLPFMLATTLTEPVWPLFILGLLAGYWKLLIQNRTLRTSFRETASADGWKSLRSSLDLTTTKNSIVSLTLVLLWFLILVAYVLLRRPSMYDGLRHFLFILPPIFIFTGLAFEFLAEGFQRIRLIQPGAQLTKPMWLHALVILALLSPGALGIFRLHPYEYTYYNSFIGGTDQAFRKYETDYWLTCYKEAVQQLEQTLEQPVDLYVHREAYIAGYYADENITVHDLRGALEDVQPGDTILVNTRTNEDLRVFKDAPHLLQISRGKAVFCIVKRIP